MTEVIFLVDGNKAVSKEVKLDISDDTHYAVVSGVEEGDEVITGPFRVLSRTLKDGDLIEYEKSLPYPERSTEFPHSLFSRTFSPSDLYMKRAWEIAPK